jgi:O-antigen ligase
MTLSKLDRSSIYLALVLLFGLLCAQALCYFTGIPWERRFTVVLYCIASAWLLILLAVQRRRWWAPCRLDWLVLLFWSVVAISVVCRLELTEDTTAYLLYAPFMVVLPYLCGRLIPICSWHRLMQATLIMGLLVTLLTLMDRFYFASNSTFFVRWPIFGYDHGRLLVGALFATALTFACVFCLKTSYKNNSKSLSFYFITYGFTILITIVLVFILARGWLIAGLFGSAIIVLSIKTARVSKRICLIIIIAATAVTSHLTFSKFEPHYSHFLTASYSETDFNYSFDQFKFKADEKEHALTEDRCRALQGAKSSSVRELLYLEALTMFIEAPIVGVGAAKFGHFSCWAAANSYPHSTILQVFAELGLIGGSLFISALILALTILKSQAALARQPTSTQTPAGAFALLCVFILADQFYGNYLMATGTWLMLGIAASVSNEMSDLKNDNE